MTMKNLRPRYLALVNVNPGFEISGGPVAQGHQQFCGTTGTLGTSGPTGH